MLPSWPLCRWNQTVTVKCCSYYFTVESKTGSEYYLSFHLHAWYCHFSFTGESFVHWACIWSSAWDALHDLSFLHPLQLRHVGHDPSAACLQTLSRLQGLISLRASSQQLAGSISHPDLMVDLLLNVAVLQRAKEKVEKEIIRKWQSRRNTSVRCAFKQILKI